VTDDIHTYRQTRRTDYVIAFSDNTKHSQSSNLHRELTRYIFGGTKNAINEKAKKDNVRPDSRG